MRPLRPRPPKPRHRAYFRFRPRGRALRGLSSRRWRLRYGSARVSPAHSRGRPDVGRVLPRELSELGKAAGRGDRGARGRGVGQTGRSERPTKGDADRAAGRRGAPGPHVLNDQRQVGRRAPSPALWLSLSLRASQAAGVPVCGHVERGHQGQRDEGRGPRPAPPGWHVHLQCVSVRSPDVFPWRKLLEDRGLRFQVRRRDLPDRVVKGAAGLAEAQGARPRRDWFGSTCMQQGGFG
ncbi:hypothetical protein TREES_T100021414 [Tupaia chinensis]|uniref:Uncharacterized protein n=1 Tax=Tupaia chinensis TaxID=246437 RepID=L9L214_TUPCH|nr:hypothetical protein TREES_T100021414 [Tupaia chinensis]